MVVDTSALIAILWSEPDAEIFARATDAATTQISAVSFLEASIVLAYRGKAAAIAELDMLIADAGIAVVPFTLEHARIARLAYLRYGRGAEHSARLNFGDCASYALAKATGDPLLFKGEDFALTDISSALGAR